MQTEIRWQELEFDLATFCKKAGQTFPIYAIHLFGSRRFKSGSVRSDIDMFFETEENIKPSYLCNAPGSLDTSLSHAAGLIEIAACHA